MHELHVVVPCGYAQGEGPRVARVPKDYIKCHATLGMCCIIITFLYQSKIPCTYLTIFICIVPPCIPQCIPRLNGRTV